MVRHTASALLFLALHIEPALVAGCSEQAVTVGGVTVGISTSGKSAFRLRIGDVFDSLDSLMVRHTDPDEVCEHTTGHGWALRTWAPFGWLGVDTSGKIVLMDPGQNVLAMSAQITGNTTLTFQTKGGELYGRGASLLDRHTLTATGSTAKVAKGAVYTPYYYSLADGYGALGAVGPDPGAGGGEMGLSYKTNFSTVTWEHAPGSFYLYLIPAPTLAEGTKRYYDLLGKSQVLPMYAFGFGASRAGWSRREFVHTLESFRYGGYPMDYIMSDTQWSTDESVRDFPPTGRANYTDFGYSTKFFGHADLSLHLWTQEFSYEFGGARTPTIGSAEHLAELVKYAWVLPNGETGLGTSGGTGNYPANRSMNFLDADARGWYSFQLENTSKVMSFWWNVGGDTNYYTYLGWNMAERRVFTHLQKRFMSMNDGWTPGMAVLGAVALTGDTSSTWEDLRGTPGMLVNWVLGGAPYVGCDVGGVKGNASGALLVRWLQLGAFMPVMRVDSSVDATPRFPWNYDNATQAAYRMALELRYRLVPYHYSLAFRLNNFSETWIRPLVMDFPDEPSVANITTQFMDGGIMVATVLREDSVREITLPKGLWYLFSWERNSTSCLTIQGGQVLGGVAQLTEVSAFVRPGTVVTLAEGRVASSRDTPYSPLEVQVYAGADGAFTLYEDGGASADEKRPVRSTVFRWYEQDHYFAWEVYPMPSLGVSWGFYEQMQITIFDGASGNIIRSGMVSVGKGGGMGIGMFNRLTFYE